MYFIGAAPVQGTVHAYFAALAVAIPAGGTLLVETGGDIIEDTTGALTGSWTGTAQAPISTSAAGAYAAPVGFVLEWMTNFVHNGRKVRGKTYIVPAGRDVFGPNGTLDDATVASLQAGGDTFVANTGSEFRIWSRPRAATPSWTDVHGTIHPARPAVAGANFVVGGCRVPDKAVVLRSRRD
jgi:hypothetical protein